MKKIIVMLLAMIVTFSSMGVTAYAQTTNSVDTTNLYYYQQISDLAKTFYHGLDTLDLTSGVGSVDLSDEIGQDLIQKYINDGDSVMIQAFQDARDAYMYDHADIFYVDWEKLTLRCGMQDGKYKAFLGNGGYTSFYVNDGFQSKSDVDAAIVKVNEKMDAMITETKKLDTDKAKVKYVHDQIADMTTYIYKEEATKEQAPFISNIYGPLMKGSALCEGYSRTFKMAMDRLGFQSVLVVGLGLRGNEQGGSGENHMWNYVLMDDNQWYAVDVTFDDPIIKTGTLSTTGKILQTFMLVGSNTFSPRHIEDGRFSQGGKEFTYPVLSESDYGQFEVSENDPKLVISSVSGDEEIDGKKVSYTRFIPSYDGKTNLQLNKEGKFWAWRYVLDNGNTGYWSDMNLIVIFEREGYVDVYASDYKKDGSEIIGYQFCLVEEDPAGQLGWQPNEDKVIANSMVYETYVENKTETVYRPFIVKSTPVTTSPFRSKTTQHVTIEYSEALKLLDASQAPLIQVETDYSNPNYQVSNFKWKNTKYTNVFGEEEDHSLIEFDFLPDTNVNYSGTTYAFTFTNLVSIANETSPNTFRLVWSSPELSWAFCPTYGAPSNLLIAPYPKLVSTENPANSFTDPFGNLILNNTSSLNISLQASKPASTTQNAMDDALEGEGVDISKVFANFDLSISCMSLRTEIKEGSGQTLKIALPYPIGFDSRDMPDVEFKAYHFKETPKGSGNYVAEEIQCIATPEGIWIIAKDFSPFSIIMDTKDKDSNTYQAAAMLNDEMYTVTVDGQASDIEVFNTENPTKSFVYTAKDGYTIHKLQVYVDGIKTQTIDVNSDSYTYILNYADMRGDVVLKAEAVAKTVLDVEKKAHIDAIEPLVSIISTNQYELPTEIAFSDGNDKVVSEITGSEIIDDIKSPVITSDVVTYGIQLSQIKLSDGWKWIDNSIVPTVINKGYQAYLEVDSRMKDYTSVPGYEADKQRIVRTISLSVNKAKLKKEMFEFTAPSNLQWDGSAKKATVTGIGDIEVVYYDVNENKLENAPVNAGQYIVKINVKESDNYLGVSNLTDISWTFTITATYKVQTIESQTQLNTIRKVTAEGLLTDGSKLIINHLKDESEGYKAFKNMSSKELIAFDLSVFGGYQGEIKITLTLTDSYNGKKVRLLHYVNGQVDVSEELEITDGHLKTTVTSFSPFAIEILDTYNISNTPDIRPLLPNISATTPVTDLKDIPYQQSSAVETDDGTKIELYWLLGVISLCVISSAILLNRKQKKL